MCMCVCVAQYELSAVVTDGCLPVSVRLWLTHVLPSFNFCTLFCLTCFHLFSLFITFISSSSSSQLLCFNLFLYPLKENNPSEDLEYVHRYYGVCYRFSLLRILHELKFMQFKKMIIITFEKPNINFKVIERII